MISCRDVHRLERAYVHGTLSSHDAWAVERHAASCATCYAQLEVLTRVHVPAEASLPGDAWPAIDAQLTSRGAASPLPPWSRWSVPYALSAMLACLIAVVVWRGVGFSSESEARPGTVIGAEQWGREQLAERARALASFHALREQRALEAAADELRHAMQRAPRDTLLVGYLADVEQARKQLRARIDQPFSPTPP